MKCHTTQRIRIEARSGTPIAVVAALLSVFLVAGCTGGEGMVQGTPQSDVESGNDTWSGEDATGPSDGRTDQDGSYSDTDDRKGAWIGIEQKVEWMQQDLQENVDQDEQETVRYISLVHAYNNQTVTEQEFKRLQNSISMAVNSLSRGNSVVRPTPVEGSRNTVLRIDLDDYAWDKETWEEIIENYPYGIQYDDDSEIFPKINAQGRVEDLRQETGSEIPYVQADWFIEETLKAPLYYDILELENRAALEQAIGGEDIDQNVQDRNVMRAGLFKPDGAALTDDHRVLERHSLGGDRALWVAYEFADSSNEAKNIKINPFGFEEDSREYIFHLQNGLQGYYSENVDAAGQGARANRIDNNIISETTREDGSVLNAVSCMKCHHGSFDGIRTGANQGALYELKTGEASDLNGEELNEFLDAYKSPDAIKQKQQEDRQLFVSARQEARMEGAKETGAPDVFTFVRQYERNLGLERVAMNLGLSKERLASGVTRARRSQALPDEFDGLVSENFKIDKETYENNEDELICAIGIGQPRVADGDPDSGDGIVRDCEQVLEDAEEDGGGQDGGGGSSSGDTSGSGSDAGGSGGSDASLEDGGFGTDAGSN